ncbi:MAG TPA: AarF/UbiB family protein [Acidimicrobiales bacterium]|nr:AarF/UbiB family protein [Acidimicrobiales bacterium]
MTFDPIALTVTIKIDSWLSLLVTVVFVVVMAAASRRVLGVRPGKLSGIICSILGWTVGIAGADAAVRNGDKATAFALAVLFGLLATMAFTIISEIVASPRARDANRSRRRAFLHPLSRIREALSPISRFWEVSRHARRRGLARPRFASIDGIASEEFGDRLRQTLEDSGGMFVKFGQIASTRGDLLAPPVIEALSELRSSVRPIPADEVRPLIENELDQRVEEVFASFEWEPLAAASIGQTHRAVLFSGERVVVKVQRPGMSDLLRRDATVLRMMASIAERRVPSARRLGLRDLAEELIISMSRELDYQRESAMSKRLDTQSGSDMSVSIPRMHDSLSTSRLLVMEEIMGRSVDDALALETCGVPRDVLAKGLLQAFIFQMLQGGAYHADPHPGNVFVDGVGQLWLLDFGAVGLLDTNSRQSLKEIALGMSIGEPLLVARAVRRLSGTDSVDLRLLEADLSVLMVEADAGGRFDPKAIPAILSLMARHGLRVPRSMTTLSRALLTLDGTLKIIDPLFEMSTEATALVGDLDADAASMTDDVVKHELLRALPVLRGLPDHFDELATQLRAGRMRVQMERFAGEDRKVVDGWLDKILIVAIGGFGTLSSAVLLAAAGTAHSPAVSDALRGVGFVGLAFGLILLMRSLAQILQNQRRPPRRE